MRVDQGQFTPVSWTYGRSGREAWPHARTHHHSLSLVWGTGRSPEPEALFPTGPPGAFQEAAGLNKRPSGWGRRVRARFPTSLCTVLLRAAL